jgi:hypothetical protein
MPENSSPLSSELMNQLEWIVIHARWVHDNACTIRERSKRQGQKDYFVLVSDSLRQTIAAIPLLISMAEQMSPSRGREAALDALMEMNRLATRAAILADDLADQLFPPMSYGGDTFPDEREPITVDDHLLATAFDLSVQTAACVRWIAGGKADVDRLFPERPPELLEPEARKYAAEQSGRHPNRAADWFASGKIESLGTNAAGIRVFRRQDIDAYIAALPAPKRDDPDEIERRKERERARKTRE